ncbi:hypothetical protein BFJ68_g12665 [Fusarium oxysporum]|uniref:Uncharacterized protein n=1 Tax=Fusarium oxysporum TaxID=5507 RepID=A0A420Q775_FUSOX|nr:hypothetical protein BFJ68_g12665 [Fusarium oxysporum]RKL00830.1 hypothetical protein BFJ71_g5485 [Fusarium oxysporum]
MRNKHWVTISSREKDTVNLQGRRHSPHVILQENPDSDLDGNDPNHTLQCRLDEHDGPQPPFGPPPSPIKHQCRNLEPLSPLIANHLRQSAEHQDEQLVCNTNEVNVLGVPFLDDAFTSWKRTKWLEWFRVSENSLKAKKRVKGLEQ